MKTRVVCPRSYRCIVLLAQDDERTYYVDCSQGARALHLVEETVKSHVGHILAKLGVAGRTQAVLAIPVALFEFSLGVWLVVKGFQPSPITRSV